ncbi:unnamed protein product [Malus baccata var. baccata]
MAKNLQNLSSTYTILITISFFFFSTLVTSETHHFSRPLSPSKHGLKREKLSHLHFYFHDIVGGRTPTAIKVAEALTTNTSMTGFGTVVMMDDPLTIGPESSSKLVGKAQGKYNGSTLSVLGRNAVFSAVREMPIVGGSGLFRFARGYAHASTHQFDIKTGDAVVEYNVYVFHY